MKTRTLPTLLLLFIFACKNTSNSQAKDQKFDKAKWAETDGVDYPHRNGMLNDFITSYKLNGVKKDSLVNLLGLPDRTDSSFLFYKVAQERWGFLPIHTKTLVVKLTADSLVEWRKIHK